MAEVGPEESGRSERDSRSERTGPGGPAGQPDSECSNQGGPGPGPDGGGAGAFMMSADGVFFIDRAFGSLPPCRRALSPEPKRRAKTRRAKRG